MTTPVWILPTWVLLASCDAATLTTSTSALTGTHHEIRISEAVIGANGHTKREVLVFGTHADGSPAIDAVVVGLDKSAAGSLTRTELVLGPLGATTYFRPCSEATPGCLGTATLTLALASAPMTPVATVPIELVTPTHVATAAPCRRAGTTLYFDADDYIMHGMRRITEWNAPYTMVNTPTTVQEVYLSLNPKRITQGNNWTLSLDSYSYPQGSPLVPGMYRDAQRSHSSSTGHPGLAFGGDGAGCNTVNGAFEIHDINVTAAGLQSLTVSFEQQCDSGPVLDGCLHYEN